MCAKQVTTDNFENEVLKSEIPVLVDFYADWCGPCKMIAPIVEELSNEYEGKCDVYKVNVDDASEVAAKYGIASIPTILFFKSGEVVETVVGAVSKQALISKIDSHI